MNEYDMIYEELCERVECGELTLEEAELINDVAYDKYVSEGNTFNKLAKYHSDEAGKHASKVGAYNMELWLNDDTYSDKMKDKFKSLRNKHYKKSVRHMFSPSLNAENNGRLSRDYDVYDIDDDFHNGKKDPEQIARNRKYKQRWMETHGNTGLTPEEKYPARRYLRIQNDMR